MNLEKLFTTIKTVIVLLILARLLYVEYDSLFLISEIVGSLAFIISEFCTKSIIDKYDQ